MGNNNLRSPLGFVEISNVHYCGLAAGKYLRIPMGELNVAFATGFSQCALLDMRRTELSYSQMLAR